MIDTGPRPASASATTHAGGRAILLCARVDAVRIDDDVGADLAQVVVDGRGHGVLRVDIRAYECDPSPLLVRGWNGCVGGGARFMPVGSEAIAGEPVCARLAGR